MNFTKSDAKEYTRKYMRGIWAAALTPFNDDLTIDEDGFRRNIQHWVEDLGIDGLFIAGKQGEFFSMSVEERKQAFDIAVEAMGDKAGTIMSCSDQKSGCRYGLGPAWSKQRRRLHRRSRADPAFRHRPG